MTGKSERGHPPTDLDPRPHPFLQPETDPFKGCVSSALARSFPIASNEAQAAADSWLYGLPFRIETALYRVTRYYLAGDKDLAVNVTLSPYTNAAQSSDTWGRD
jgi:hypothetical protein